MRCYALLATIFAATVGTSSALVEARRRTTVEVAASAYDERTSGYGCSPDGCVPENTRDNNLSNNSRWSCKGELVEDDGEGCWIEYYFDEPQDIVEMSIALYKGKKEPEIFEVYVNGVYFTQIETSGETNGFQTFSLGTDETAELRIYLSHWASNSDWWLSFKEVRFMVE